MSRTTEFSKRARERSRRLRRQRIRVPEPNSIIDLYRRALQEISDAALKAARTAVQAGLSRVSVRARARVAAKRAASRVDLVSIERRLDSWNLATVNKTIRRVYGDKGPQAKGRVVDSIQDAKSSAFIRENIKLITKMSDDLISEIGDILEENEGARWEDIAKEIERRVEVSRSRSELIARDQVLSLNANLTQKRHEDLGARRYEWNCAGPKEVGDGRVRENHLKLDGKIFEYAKPPMGGGTGPKDRGNPGSGIRCRCQPIPVFDEDLFANVEEDPKPIKNDRLDVTGVSVEKLSGSSSELRQASLEFLRKGGKPRKQAPIVFEKYPDTDLVLADGRHRITVAREKGKKTVPAVFREYGADGELKAEKKISVKI